MNPVTINHFMVPEPAQVAVLFNQGLKLHEQGQLLLAKVIYERVLAKQSDHFDALHLLGVLAFQTGNPLLAADLIGQAIEINSNYAAPHNNRGNALKELQRLDEALASYDQAITLKPDYAEAFYNRGNALKELKRLDEALASYDQAITLKPGYAKAFNNRGSALQELKRTDEALASYDQAIALKPDYAEAFYNRGNALQEPKRLDEALASYEKALALQPDDFDFLPGTKLHTQMQLCDWRDFASQLDHIKVSIAGGRKAIYPFAALGLMDQPELQLKASRIYADAEYPASLVPGETQRRKPDGKIRIGYYSADFLEHPVSQLIVELFELHDADRFEVYGFSFSGPSSDELRRRVAKALDHFIDVSTNSDREVTQMSRSLGIDIAIDLGGFTRDLRTGIFAARCAPIQINYIGYPGTMGADYIDYIIADRVLIPEESRSHYSEKIIYMPNSFQVNDSRRRISDRVFTRQELGLPESGFVFCCFNASYKILPATFDGWMRLLKAVDGSVLWLVQDSALAAKNLCKEAENRGVDPVRLVFAGRIKGNDHLARQRVADLFLDTLPFNAGATASAALWSGLPILTLLGRSFASRYGASLLRAIDLPELITETQEQYESMAVELATNPLRLARIKEKLACHRLKSPLFNGPLFARQIEAAYAEIYRRHLGGEKPDHLDVEALMG